MARIRSVKPEFWSDQELARMPRDVRMLYLALWNFCDESARMPGDPRLVKADCFPLDDDITPDIVSAWLDELSEAGKVVRYTVNGSRYLYLPKLATHQNLDTRLTSRHPEPPAETLPTEINIDESARIHVETQTSQRSRAGKQVAGSRLQVAGTANAERAATHTDESTRTSGNPPDTAQVLIAEWIDHVPKRPPGAVIGQVGKHLRTMLAEGQDPDDLRRGLAAWSGKGLHPSSLPSVVNEVMNGQARASPGRSTTDDRVRQAIEAGRAAQASERAPP